MRAGARSSGLSGSGSPGICSKTSRKGPITNIRSYRFLSIFKASSKENTTFLKTCFIHFFFPECVARVPVSLGGLGVRLCSPSFAFAFATVRNRRQPFAVPP